jgi:hypothetical protein
MTMDSAYMGDIMGQIGRDVWKMNLLGTCQSNRVGCGPTAAAAKSELKIGTYESICSNISQRVCLILCGRMFTLLKFWKWERGLFDVGGLTACDNESGLHSGEKCCKCYVTIFQALLKGLEPCSLPIYCDGGGFDDCILHLIGLRN